MLKAQQEKISECVFVISASPLSGFCVTNKLFYHTRVLMFNDCSKYTAGIAYMRAKRLLDNNIKLIFDLKARD
jgi:hypothetical protein